MRSISKAEFLARLDEDNDFHCNFLSGSDDWAILDCNECIFKQVVGCGGLRVHNHDFSTLDKANLPDEITIDYLISQGVMKINTDTYLRDKYEIPKQD